MIHLFPACRSATPWRETTALFVLLALLSVGCARNPDGAGSLPVREARTWTVPSEETMQPAPRSMASGGPGEVYVLDTAGRVLVYASDGTLARQWRMPEVAAGKPEGIVRLNDGHLIVCDTHYHRVVEFDAGGKVAGMFGREGKGPGEFIYPVAVTTDPRENLYVAEYGSNDRIQVFTRQGGFLRAFGGFGTKPGDFQRPSGLVWIDNRLYVCDAFNNRIQVFSDQGAFLKVLETPALQLPYDLKLGADHTLYVVEYGPGRVTHLNLDGRLIGRYGSRGTGLGQFVTPWGIAVLADGRLIVADTGNRRLVELAMETARVEGGGWKVEGEERRH